MATLAVPHTFSTIIEADHKSIRTLANKITSRHTTHETRLTLLPTLIARLIRHDISEELVMRPAFARYLGSEGTTAAEQDRVDHADLKDKLLALYRRVLVDDGDDGDKWLRGEVRALADEMGRHMDEESGRVLPVFEARVGREVGLVLGREYVRTLLLTEDIEVGSSGCRWFGGLEEYARADVDVFREVLRGLETGLATVDGREAFERRVRVELKEIGLDSGPDLDLDLGLAPLRGGVLKRDARGVSGKL